MRWYPDLTGTAHAVQQAHDARGESQERETDAPEYWVVHGLDAQHEAYIEPWAADCGAEACLVDER
ncbi:MAG: hypothetical protein ACRDRY_07190 [Pseudonocardiaceae bacterium]